MGRPDLLEKAGRNSREIGAKQMYNRLTNLTHFLIFFKYGQVMVPVLHVVRL
jgi:hypothetical protein